MLSAVTPGQFHSAPVSQLFKAPKALRDITEIKLLHCFRKASWVPLLALWANAIEWRPKKKQPTVYSRNQCFPISFVSIDKLLQGFQRFF